MSTAPTSVKTLAPAVFPTPPTPKNYSIPDYSSKKDVFLAIATIALCIILFAALETFGDYGSIDFIATVTSVGVVALVSVGAYIFFVRAERKARNGLTHDPRDEMVAFARAELAHHPELKPVPFRNKTQPINPEIAMLSALYLKIQYALDCKLKPSTWNTSETTILADKALKISYAIGVLTLEDLPAITRINNAKDRVDVLARQTESQFESVLRPLAERPTFGAELGNPGNYMSRSFLIFTQIYHWMRRSGALYDKESERTYVADDPTHYVVFYQPGTIQYGWRLLYNDFCDKFLAWVPPETWTPKDNPLNHLNERIVLWHQKDEDLTTFRSYPSSLPIVKRESDSRVG